jgi:hypothetical protein
MAGRETSRSKGAARNGYVLKLGIATRVGAPVLLLHEPPGMNLAGPTAVSRAHAALVWLGGSTPRRARHLQSCFAAQFDSADPNGMSRVVHWPRALRTSGRKRKHPSLPSASV